MNLTLPPTPFLFPLAHALQVTREIARNGHGCTWIITFLEVRIVTSEGLLRSGQHYLKAFVLDDPVEMVGVRGGGGWTGQFIGGLHVGKVSDALAGARSAGKAGRLALCAGRLGECSSFLGPHPCPSHSLLPCPLFPSRTPLPSPCAPHAEPAGARGRPYSLHVAQRHGRPHPWHAERVWRCGGRR